MLRVRSRYEGGSQFYYRSKYQPSGWHAPPGRHSNGDQSGLKWAATVNAHQSAPSSTPIYNLPLPNLSPLSETPLPSLAFVHPQTTLALCIPSSSSSSSSSFFSSSLPKFPNAPENPNSAYSRPSPISLFYPLTSLRLGANRTFRAARLGFYLRPADYSFNCSLSIVEQSFFDIYDYRYIYNNISIGYS